jgi:hypothetical protein
MEKFTFEPQDILERLYRPAQVYDGKLTEAEFLSLPLNEAYIQNQKNKESQEKVTLKKIESNTIIDDSITKE